MRLLYGMEGLDAVRFDWMVVGYLSRWVVMPHERG